MLDLTNTTLDDISAVVGFSATIRLASYYGGRDLHVPIEVSDLHPVAKLIGMSCLNALANEWRGERLTVPSLGFVDIESRNAKILLLLLQNVDCYTIANVVGIGYKRVTQIRQEFLSNGLISENAIPKIDAETAV